MSIKRRVEFPVPMATMNNGQEYRKVGWSKGSGGNLPTAGVEIHIEDGDLWLHPITDEGVVSRRVRIAVPGSAECLLELGRQFHELGLAVMRLEAGGEAERMRLKAEEALAKDNILKALRVLDSQVTLTLPDGTAVPLRRARQQVPEARLLSAMILADGHLITVNGPIPREANLGWNNPGQGPFRIQAHPTRQGDAARGEITVQTAREVVQVLTTRRNELLAIPENPLQDDTEVDGNEMEAGPPR